MTTTRSSSKTHGQQKSSLRNAPRTGPKCAQNQEPPMEEPSSHRQPLGPCPVIYIYIYTNIYKTYTDIYKIYTKYQAAVRRRRPGPAPRRGSRAWPPPGILYMSCIYLYISCIYLVYLVYICIVVSLFYGPEAN